MKICSSYFYLFSMIALVTAKSCEVPHVAMTVQFAGKTSLGTQQASEFVLPLFSDCTYQFPGDAVLASGKWILRLIILNLSNIIDSHRASTGDDGCHELCRQWIFHGQGGSAA
jgi:hypothetical protein